MIVFEALQDIVVPLGLFECLRLLWEHCIDTVDERSLQMIEMNEMKVEATL